MDKDIISGLRYLTPENSVFKRLEGGLVSLLIKENDRNSEEFPIIALRRCFPFSDPTHYWSVCEFQATGKEIGIIEDVKNFSNSIQIMLEEQIALNNFIPIICEIHQIKIKDRISQWTVNTDKGACILQIPMDGGSINHYSNRYFLKDNHGNQYCIPDITDLSPKETKLLNTVL